MRTPRYLIEPTFQNYCGEFSSRKDPSLTYEKYFDEWGTAIEEVMEFYIEFNVDKNLGKTSPSFEVTTGIPEPVPDSSREAYEKAKGEKGVDSYTYEQFLAEWKVTCRAVAKQYVACEKQRRLEENADKLPPGFE